MTEIAKTLTTPLSKEEISKGNKLFLQLLKFNTGELGVRCAKYETSYDELFKVSRAIIALEGKGMEGAFEYRHSMFHEVLDFSSFYRKTMKVVEKYYESQVALEVT